MNDKFKNGLRDTINYYENIIEGLVKENKLLKKQADIEEVV
jgi:hypothetical protein